MSQSENPRRLQPDHTVSIDDVRALMGASTPHFALQLRQRIRTLIAPLAPDDVARQLGEREIARLNEIAKDGEIRGHQGEEGLPPLLSLTPDP